jgi:hypothetical protein
MRKSLFVMSAVVLLELLPTPIAQGANRPSVVFFLVDDLGWTDLGCFGSTFYETPTSMPWPPRE